MPNLWVRFMAFSAHFNNNSVIIYRSGQFYWWRKREYLEKTTDLSPVTDKLYDILLYNWVHLTISGSTTWFSLPIIIKLSKYISKYDNVIFFCFPIYYSSPSTNNINNATKLFSWSLHKFHVNWVYTWNS